MDSNRCTTNVVKHYGMYIAWSNCNVFTTLYYVIGICNDDVLCDCCTVDGTE